MDPARALHYALQHVLADLAALERITAMAVDEATSAESKAENKYDTRSLEASYLAAGQGERVLALRQLAAQLAAWTPGPDRERLELFGLARLADPDGWYLLLPGGGGRRVQVDGVEVVVVTPESPAGVALRGAQVGDVVKVGRDEREVLDVR